MKRYSQDYGIEFQSPTNRRPLARAEAVRVIAAPLPKRTSEPLRSTVVALAIGLAVVVMWALAFVIAFAS